MSHEQEPVSPSDFVVPIVGLHDDGDCGPFLGTAAFVGDRPTLITCAHVLDGWGGGYGIVIETETRVAEAYVLICDTSADLALLEVPNYQPPRAIPLALDGEIILNDFVICFEYGTTVTAGTHIEFSPANRLGNVTRFRNLHDRYQTAGNQMLELSFPALKGASGAPVMTWRPPFKLWGIVTANVSYELLPAQVESIIDDRGNLTEERRFYLPQALAIHVKHLRNLLEKHQI